MAISDINKAMALYAQPTQFDQRAWKTAFDIANAFTNAENNRTVAEANKVKAEDLKRLYSNALQTDPSAIQSTIAQNNFNTTQYKIGEQGILGQDEAAKLVARYGFDKNGNAVALPQVFKNATADGYNPTNPYATSSFYQAGNQERANQQALYLGIANNSMGTTIDAAGNVVSTGQIDPQKLTNNLNMMVATGMITKEQADNLHKGFSIEVPHQEIKRFQSILNPQPQIIFPYRLDAQPAQNTTNTAIPQVATQTVQPAIPPQVDLRKAYNLSDEDMKLVQQAQSIGGLNEQEAINRLSAAFTLRSLGHLAGERFNRQISSILAQLKQEKENAERHQRLQQQTMPVIPQPLNNIPDVFGRPQRSTTTPTLTGLYGMPR